MLRLIHHEVRQVLDTRGSLVALVLAFLLSAVLVAVSVFLVPRPTSSVSPAETVGIVTLVVPLGVGLVVVLATTGEWTHHTGRVTLPMVRSRTALFASKSMAMLLLSTALYLLAAGLASVTAIGVTLLRGHSVEWAYFGGQLWAGQISTWLAAVFGFGIATVVRGFALASLTVVGVTLGWNTLATRVFHDDQGYLASLTPITLATVGQGEGSSPPVTAVLSSLLLWYVLPVLIGWWRYLRTEV